MGKLRLKIDEIPANSTDLGTCQDDRNMDRALLAKMDSIDTEDGVQVRLTAEEVANYLADSSTSEKVYVELVDGLFSRHPRCEYVEKVYIELVHFLSRCESVGGIRLFSDRAARVIQLWDHPNLSGDDSANLYRITNAIAEGGTYKAYNFDRATGKLTVSLGDQSKTYELKVPDWLGIEVMVDGHALVLYDRQHLASIAVEGGMTDFTTSGVVVASQRVTDPADDFIDYSIGNSMSGESDFQSLVDRVVDIVRMNETHAKGQTTFQLGSKTITAFGPTRDGYYHLLSSQEQSSRLYFNPRTKDIQFSSAGWKPQFGETRAILPESVDWEQGVFTVRYDCVDESGVRKKGYPYDYVVNFNDVTDVHHSYTVDLPQVK